MSANDPADAWPRLTPAVAADHHLLLLGPDVEWEEFDALARPAAPGSAWDPEPSAPLPGRLDLLAAEHAEVVALGHEIPTLPDGSLERASFVGPWRVDIVNRRALGLPEWAATAFVLDLPPERSGPAPHSPAGHGEFLDAFGSHHPIGLERAVLDLALACARRLAGGVRVAFGVVLEPDPASAVDITLYSPTWLDPAALAAVLTPHLPGLAVLTGVDADVAATLEGYGAHWAPTAPVGLENDDAESPPPHRGIAVDVMVAEVLPGALADAPWTVDGVIGYHLRWLAEGDEREPSTRAARRDRAEIRGRLAAAALALHAAAGGELLDEDSFLLDPEALRAP